MKLNNTKDECYLKYIFFILQMYRYAGFFFLNEFQDDAIIYDNQFALGYT